MVNAKTGMTIAKRINHAICRVSGTIHMSRTPKMAYKNMQANNQFE
jgi:hypothetical protein